MAQRQVRKHVATATAGLALCVLLAGPATTFGVDVSLSGGTTDQVAATTGSVVTTAEQTAGTAVTQVQTTVDQTVPSAPAAETVTTQVQPSAGTTVTAAPTQAVSHAAAPVQKKTTAARTPAAAVPKVAAVGGATRQAPATTLAAPVRRSITAAGTKARAPAKRIALTAPTESAGAQTTSECADLTMLNGLPGLSELSALLSMACDAGIDLGLPVGSGASRPNAAQPSAIEVVGDMLSGGRLSARSAALDHGAAADVPVVSRTASGDVLAARESLATAAPARAAGGRFGALAYFDARNAAHVTAAHDDGASSGSAHKGNGLFGGPIDGTKALLLLLFIDFVVLVALATWRIGTRWVVPRTA